LTTVAAFEIGELVKWATEDGSSHVAKVKSIDGDVVTVVYGQNRTREFYTSELVSFTARRVKFTETELVAVAQTLVAKGQTEFRHFYDAPKPEVTKTEVVVSEPVIETPVATFSKRDKTPVEVYFNRVVDFILNNDTFVSRSDILATVDMPQSKWVQVSKMLERDSRVIAQGVKKGRRYGKKGATVKVIEVAEPKPNRAEKRAAKNAQAKKDAKTILDFIKKSKTPVGRAQINEGTGINNGRYAAAIKLVAPKVKVTGIKRATKYTAK
jgi:hypothetical protein